MNRNCDHCGKVFQDGLVRIRSGEEDESKCDQCVKDNTSWGGD